MKIYRIAEMGTQQDLWRKGLQEYQGRLQQSVALVNKSFDTLKTEQMENFFQKDGFINQLENGNIENRIDINKTNTAIQAMQAITQAALAINQTLREAKDDGIPPEQLKADLVQSLRNSNFSAFVSTMQDYQTQLPGQTGTVAPK